MHHAQLGQWAGLGATANVIMELTFLFPAEYGSLYSVSPISGLSFRQVLIPSAFDVSASVKQEVSASFPQSKVYDLSDQLNLCGSRIYPGLF